jgi:hypothetical protein
VAPLGIAHTPFVLKSQPTKLAGLLICADVSPFAALSVPPPEVWPVVCAFQ